MKYILSAILLVSGIVSAAAQEVLGGTIIYTRTTTYNFNATGNAEWDAYAKTLPSEGKFEKHLLFTPEASLYNEAVVAEDALSVAHQKALFFVNYGKAPKPTLKQLYVDFKNENRCAMLEFMTREFRVESPLENKGWKLQPERKKIGDYVCMKATGGLEGDMVTAWFTPEIPVPAGPAEYYGLPGLVLAVERLGETIFLATSVELSPPGPEELVKPDTGKKISLEAFDRIVDEKVEEYKQNGPAKSNYYHK